MKIKQFTWFFCCFLLPEEGIIKKACLAKLQDGSFALIKQKELPCMENMPRKYSHHYVPSPQRITRIMEMLQQNQQEMDALVAEVLAANGDLIAVGEPRFLLRLGSYLYDYYLLLEEIMLALASLADQWTPGSLDWHVRLLKLLSSPVKEVRPPAFSPDTASFLEGYLYFYLSFHHNCSNLSREKMNRLVNDLERTHKMVMEDLARFNRVLKMLYRC